MPSMVQSAVHTATPIPITGQAESAVPTFNFDNLAVVAVLFPHG
jgi:hypothetical protein